MFTPVELMGSICRAPPYASRPGTPTCTRTWRKAALHEASRLVDGSWNLRCRRHARNRSYRLAAFSAQELVDGQSRLPSFDIPQRLVHAADGVIEEGPFRQ